MSQCKETIRVGPSILYCALDADHEGGCQVDMGALVEPLAALAAPPQAHDVRAGECGWAGCGDCDPEFRCYSGRARCARLGALQEDHEIGYVLRGSGSERARADGTLPQAQGEPVMWMIVHPGCVTGLTESVYETALQKATQCPPGTAVVPLYARPDAPQAQGEPVAWRWRPKGAQLWIYNPDPEWLAQQEDDIDREPLYARPDAGKGEAEDAARYRWLREGSVLCWRNKGKDKAAFPACHTKKLDAAIDAARCAGKGEAG